MKVVKIIFGCFLVLSAFHMPLNAYADPIGDDSDETIEAETTDEENTEDSTTDNGVTCQESLGSLGWLICPTTGKLSEATDWIYSKIEEILVINPISMEEGSPIYEIWKYCRGVTNIVFCIFLLIVIISQITGIGISNYGIKKALPKLIVAAILVNLSFIICSIAVDASNIIGSSLRGIFTAVEEATVANSDIAIADISFSNINSAIAGGSALAIGGIFLAFETGVIWMLIPVVLGAIVAVASGLLTIALRQAVITLLIMISPLAFVALVLPNTEQLFKKWKNLLYKMLIFYPTFSLLFGASNLAGWAIIISAKDGFAVVLGLAVQVFPLFFSWKLMRMSGTFLSSIYDTARNIASKPLATNRAWADSHYRNKKSRYLANGVTPSAHLNRFLSDRRVSREIEADKNMSYLKEHGAAYDALRHYKKNGQISRYGERDYNLQARSMRNQQVIATDRNNFNRGLGGFSENYQRTIAETKRDFIQSKNTFATKTISASTADRLNELDMKNIEASDNLKYELSRGAKIEYDNAKGFQKRTNEAIEAHLDSLHQNNPHYNIHEIQERSVASARYDSILRIMEGNSQDVHFAAADAAYSFNSQSQVVQGKFQKYFSLTVPTQDVVHRLREFTNASAGDINANIDPIIAGLRTLNQRGDTDLVRDRLYEILENYDTGERKIDLGSYAAQSIASFCMFDVKDSDPVLRRFGKYINMETARMFNEAAPEKRRHNSKITFDEYINGEYEDYDLDNDGTVLPTTHIVKAKRGAKELLEGTSFKGMERTAIAAMTESIRHASYVTDENGNRTFDMEKFKQNQENIWNAIMPNIIGDQFSFLSGSEQIKSLAKGITGMDGHKFDWKGIFGAEIANSLTDEQKQDYIQFLNKRTKAFLGGHVPNQIARTKSDVLAAVIDLFTMTAAAEQDESIIARDKNGISNDEYKDIVEQYGLDADNKFIGSLKEETLKGFLKMWRKGYQGDTKANLTQHIHAEEQYQKYFGNNIQDNRQVRRRRQATDDEEDGPIIEPIGGGADPADAQIHQGEIDAIYMYDQAGDAHGFYVEAMEYLTSNHLEDVAREFENYYHNNSTATRADLYNYLNTLIK